MSIKSLSSGIVLFLLALGAVDAAEINGNVFQDTKKQDAKKGTDEGPAPGAIVKVYSVDEDGKRVKLEGTVTTDEFGNYQFTGLPAGTYILEFEFPYGTNPGDRVIVETTQVITLTQDQKFTVRPIPYLPKNYVDIYTPLGRLTGSLSADDSDNLPFNIFGGLAAPNNLKGPEVSPFGS